MDEHYFILLKPTFQNPTNIKGEILLKRKFKQILETMIDKADPRNLFIAYAKSEHTSNLNDEFAELNLYFEDWRKCLEIRDYKIEEKRHNQLLWEKNLVEKFLVEECEKELQSVFSVECS